MKKKLLLGYCPTMEQEANNIASNNENIQLVKSQSTKNVLNDLNQKKIDIGLVGRIAKSDELNYKYNELKLKTGFTLINSNKNVIEYSKIDNLKIHTYLDKEKVKNFLGNIDNVIFYEKLEDINPEFISLIDWDDWKDNNELLIPIDENYNKIVKFRIPVLYSLENLDKINR